MRELDIKLLWGRSASHCAICKAPLVRAEDEGDGNVAIGEQAHIVGESPKGPRGESDLTPDEREGYSNRILLCPNDHTMVDKDASSYSVARLHQIKVDHELWVEQRLSSQRDLWQEADDLIYSDLIDSAVENCRLDVWTNWTSMTLEPIWRWPEGIYDTIEPFRHKVFRTDWPVRLPDLNLALDRLSYELMEAAALFATRMEPDGETFRVTRSYKGTMHPPVVYQQLEEEFWQWSGDLEQRISSATAAANWVREVWRAEVNPLFFAVDGRFTLAHWMDSSMRGSFSAPVFTDEEKQDIRDAGMTAGDVPRRPTAAKQVEN